MIPSLIKRDPVYADVGSAPPATILPKRPHQYAGIIFDWSVFAFSILLGILFSFFTSGIASSTISWIVLAMVPCYTAAVVLKQAPLSLRISKINGTDDFKRIKSDMFTFQFLLHCIVFWVIVFAALSQIVISGVVSWWDADDQFPPFLIGLVVGITLTLMVYRLRSQLYHKSGQWVSTSKNPSVVEKKIENKKKLLRQEFIADLLLVISVSFFTTYLWGPVVRYCISSSNLTTNNGVVEFVFLVSLLYICIYLPFRLVYLVEEGGYSKRQWLSFLFLLIVLIIRSIIYVYINDW